MLNTSKNENFKPKKTQAGFYWVFLAVFWFYWVGFLMPTLLLMYAKQLVYCPQHTFISSIIASTVFAKQLVYCSQSMCQTTVYHSQCMCYTYYIMFSDWFITASIPTVLTTCHIFLHVPFNVMCHTCGLNIEINPINGNAPNNTGHHRVQKTQ